MAPLEVLVSGLVDVTSDDPFLAFQEQYLKVRLMNVALDLGWTLHEGAPGKGGADAVAHQISRSNGRLVLNRAYRELAIKGGSADITVVSPYKFMIELKTRSDFGTKSGAAFGKMLEDVARVARRADCAFVFVFDEYIYRSFCGAKSERRGRPAGPEMNWFLEHFLSGDDLARRQRHRTTGVYNGQELVVLHWCQTLDGTGVRYFVAGARPDSPSVT